MQFAESTVRKKNEEEEYGRGGLQFMAAQEGARQFLSGCGAGKILVVSDSDSYKTLSQTALSPKALSLVYDGDALALFSMPDGVGSVLAAGGEDVLRAARYFAGVRRVPCAVFPSSGTLFGAFEEHGEVTLCSEKRTVPLAAAQIYFDKKGSYSLSEAYAQVFLTALARFEQETLAEFGVRAKAQYPKIKLGTGYPDQAELIAQNAALRREERDGAPVGEGRILARLHAADGNKRPVYRAFTELIALYYAFFKCGKPRKYFICDYAARAKSAGTPYCATVVPTPQEYAVRSLALEKIRSQKLFELKEILQCWQQGPFFLKQAASLLDLKRLKFLPEHGGGLSAIIRDFGLLG